MSLTSSLAGLQRKADMMAAVSCILGLTIARTKLRVFSMDWSLNAQLTRSLEPEVILIHDMSGAHHKLTVKRGGTVKCLGVIFDPALTGKTSATGRTGRVQADNVRSGH